MRFLPMINRRSLKCLWRPWLSSTGADLFDPAILDNFGGGKYANVVSGLQYERIMSASGPTMGELKRPSDGVRPKRVAWIQCVGSTGPK